MISLRKYLNLRCQFSWSGSFQKDVILILTLMLLMPTSDAKCPSSAGSFCLQIDGFDSIVLDGSYFRDIVKALGHIKSMFEDNDDLKEIDQMLLINNHALKSLEPNAFCDFRFRRIVIQNCSHLNQIHPDAFNGTAESVKTLIIDTVAIDNPHSENFFEALNSLMNLEELELKNHKILKIRPYTFRQPMLMRLLLDGPLESIENNAFYYLDNIRILHLTKSIRFIQQHAFDLRQASNKTLDIYLESKLANIQRGVFTYTQRPLTINLYLNKLTNFDSAVFRQVLMAPMRHELIFHGNPRDMHKPCQLSWLFRHTFKGVFTFKDEPMLDESHLNNFGCSENTVSLDDEVVEIDHTNQAGIDASHNDANGRCHLPTLYATLLLLSTVLYSMQL